jgi:hypothetical protein
MADSAEKNLELLCAELCRLAYASEAVVRHSLSTVQLSLVGWFGGDTVSARAAARGTDGFVAAGRDVVAVVFRGTESAKPEDLLADLLTGSVPWPGAGQVHRGFAQAFAAVRGDLHGVLRARPASDRLVVTGHSLGAAVATLAAATLRARRPTLVTFGSPRVGDREFARSLEELEIHRFVNCCDAVARIPPETFGHDDIGRLLTDLTGSPRVSAGAALILSGVLRRLGVQPQFVHVGPARYADRHGVRQPRFTDADIEADQHAARASYRAGSTPGEGGLASLSGLVTSGLSPERVLQSFRERLTAFLATLGGDPVPLRDLADHAPLNYVSIFTGRA